MTNISRGALAGAAGTTALNAATYLDMAIRGRPASESPEQVVEQLLDLGDVEIPGDGDDYSNRRTGIAAVAGIATGVSVGAIAGWLRGRGFRLSRLGSTVLIGGSAMAITDGSMAALGVSDPRTWTAIDWASDAVPHFLYGATTAAVLQATDESVEPTAKTRVRTIVQAALAGVATGGRLTSAMTALALTSKKGLPAPVAVLAASGELVADKLPMTPSRIEGGGLIGRAVFGMSSGAIIARRRKENIDLPAIVGLGGAIAGAFGGLWWRTTGAADLNIGPLTAALIEDAAVVITASLAVAGT